MMDKLGWWDDMIENKQLYTVLQNKANNIRELEGWVMECLTHFQEQDKRGMPTFEAYEVDGMENAFSMVSEKMKELGLTQED
jgi:hypothetical protein